MSFLERYQAGEQERVWSELIALGASIRQEPIYSDAVAVARETMRRVRYNVELIAIRLGEIDYQFYNTGKHVFPPPPDIDEKLQDLEAEIGTLPLSLRAWYETIGSVDFVGQHKNWFVGEGLSRYTDPLVVDPIAGSYCPAEWYTERGSREWNEWLEAMSYTTFAEPYVIEIAPDYFHKYPCSGGGPYGIFVPNRSADAILENDLRYEGTETYFPYLRQTHFVKYLRECFRWGGFPNLQALPEALQPTEHLEYLTADLLQI